MAGREIALFLKCPGSLAVQRLRHSFLECIVEYRTGSRLELQSKTPLDLRTEFQLPGTASLVDDEIVIHFQSRCAGIHTARIFAHTRELCRPIAFRVTGNGTVESIPTNRPVAFSDPTEPSLPPPPRLSASQHSVNAPQSQAGSPPRSPASAAGSGGGSLSTYHHAATPPYSDAGVLPTESSRLPPHRRGSPHYETASVASHPRSTHGSFSGDLISSTPGVYSFSDLYTMKQKGMSIEVGLKFIDHASVITAEALKLIKRGVTDKVAKQLGKKIRCGICSRTAKPSKTITLMQAEYCQSCFRRQFMVKSATDHFMVPRVEYCGVEVPVNKKASKFVTAMMTIPRVNLRGLDFVDVRTAQREFAKFSIENDGWMDKHLVLPLIKPCLLTQRFNETEVKNTLCSQALNSLIHSYGMMRRGLVHEIEFLSLLAYAAREAHSFKSIDNPGGSKSKFTKSDLELAYAYRKELLMQSRSLRDSSHQSKSEMGTGSSHDHTPNISATQSPLHQTEASVRSPDPKNHEHELAAAAATAVVKRSSSWDTEQLVPSPNLTTHPHTVTKQLTSAATRQSQVTLQGLTDPVARKKAPMSTFENPATRFKFPSPNAVSVFPVVRNGVGEAPSVQIPKRLFERRRQSSNMSNFEQPITPHGENSLPEAEQGFAPSSALHTSPASKPKDKNEEFKLTESSADGWMMY